MTLSRISIKEWESFPNEHHKVLNDIYLPNDVLMQDTIAGLSREGKLHVEELRHGLRVRATSWVGRITLGDVQVTVEPKITGLPLLSLLRYAYGLRNLDLHNSCSFSLTQCSFVDLLIYQLASEVEELMRRGLQQEYLRQNASLSLPRGRLDIQSYIRDASLPATTLPCTFYPRLENTTINQVLLAGLHLARQITADPSLRAIIASLCRVLEHKITLIRLDMRLLQHTRQRLSRLTSAYAPAITLIELLLGAQGVNLEGDAETVSLPGFFFDMNRFFQTLLSRFLSENLTEYEVRDEHRLLGMMKYDSQYNPRRRPMPAPRPDFVVLKGNRMAAVLDAKYRDLWEKPLPRDMLYQLAIYALSQQEGRAATILYPTLDASATEAHIVIKDAVEGRRTGRVIVRPVDMIVLANLVADLHTIHERGIFARELAFGSA